MHNSEISSYASEINDLGMSSISPRAKKMIVDVFGGYFVDVASDDEKNNAYEYIHGIEKRWMDVVSGLALSMAIPVGVLAAAWINKTADDGGGKYFDLEVGFPGLNSIKIRKIRTHKPHSHENLSSPFQHVSFQAHKQEVDERLLELPGIGIVRKSGLDEIWQAKKVLSGDMTIIGPRAYDMEEVRGMVIAREILIADSTKLKFDDEMVSIFDQHPVVMGGANLKPAILNPRAALMANGFDQEDLKEIHNGVRMWMDMQYVWKASWFLDMKIGSAVLGNRVFG